MRPLRELLHWSRPARSSADSGDPRETSSPAGPTRTSPGNSQLQGLSGLASDTPAKFGQVAANEPVADTPSQRAKPNSHDISSRRWIAEQNLRTRLIDDVRAAPDVPTLRALLGLDGAEPVARTPDDEIGSFKQLTEELNAMVKSGSVLDLRHESPLPVIKAVISGIEKSPEAFHLNRSAAMDAVLEALEHAPLRDRAEGMTALSALVVTLPEQAERLYDAIFQPMHEAHANSRLDPSSRESEPFPIYDAQYAKALTNRALCVAELSPKRHLDEANAVLADVAKLAPTLRAEPLEALAQRLDSLDENAREQIFDGIWVTLEWDPDPVAGKPGARAIVLPQLAKAAVHLPDPDHRQQAVSRSLTAGYNLRGELGAQTVFNLLPAAGTFSEDGRSLLAHIILDSLAAMPDQKSYLELALVTARSDTLPKSELQRVFDNVLERLENEPLSLDYRRGEERSTKLHRLIEALDCLSDESERNARFVRLSAQIARTPREFCDSLFAALSDKLQETQGTAKTPLVPLTLASDTQVFH